MENPGAVSVDRSDVHFAVFLLTLTSLQSVCTRLEPTIENVYKGTSNFNAFAQEERNRVKQLEENTFMSAAVNFLILLRLNLKEEIGKKDLQAA